jgi:cytochrome c-type biogenesis protein CcmH/NrfG
LFALRAVEANPGYAGAYARLGHMLLHSGAVDEAVLAYRKGLALDPSAGDLQRFLSGALHIQAHPMLRKAPFDRIHAEFSSHEGVAFALAAISANPGYAGAYARLGHLLLNLGARREAASVYGQACTIDPSAADLPRFLAEASRPEAKAAPSSPARAGTKLDGQRSPAAAAKPAATAPAKRGFFRTLFESLFGS